MRIEPGSFFILVATLAVGGAGGYLAAQKRILPPLDKGPEAARPDLVSSVPDASVAATTPPDAAPPAPTCDDSAGVPGECPGPGAPTEEGAGCGGLVTKRCNEFKQAMKPKVAAAAVECLKKLNPQERCTPARVNLCGHLALVNACVEPETAVTESAKNVATTCASIRDECKSAPLGPTVADCRQTVSGLNDTGRTRMIDCVKKHCSDKGMLGCEALADAN